MKKYFVLIFCIMFSLTLMLDVAHSANTATGKVEWKMRDMIYVLVEPCTGDGDECLDVVLHLPTNPFQLNPIYGGRMLALPIISITNQYTPLNVSYSPYTVTSDCKLYTFPIGSTLRIDNCDTDPLLIGLTFNIGGLTTDNNGVLYYFIPF